MNEQRPDVVSLNGQWEYEKDQREIGLKEGHFRKIRFSSSMEIPSNWQLAGVEDYCGVIWFRRDFILPEKTDKKQVFLRFKGVDYITDVWLNGAYVGHHVGYFQTFEFNVTDQVKREGNNNLVVRVNSPLEEPGTVWPTNKYVIKGILSNSDLRPGSWSLEKGQDKNTGGIWNDVELLIKNDIHITNIKVTTKLVPDGSAIARADIAVDNRTPRAKNVIVEAVVRPANFSSGKEYKAVKEAEIRFGTDEITIVKRIADPKLWWTWDHGEQDLYFMEVSLATNNETIAFEKTRFGFRDITIDADWNWFLNGERIFIRGTMVIPTQWLSEYDHEMIAKDIELLREANVNMALPACHVNREEFYAACDEAGVLIYQDFPLMWSYEESDGFKEDAVRQMKEMVNQLYNHPSIALWCCQREATHNKDTLDPLLRDAAVEEDTTRCVLANSDFSEHAYFGWYVGTYEQFAALPGGPFVSEFGAQALPNVETMRKMFAPDDLWPPNWEKWAYHDFQHEQTFHVANVEMGKSIEEFVSNSQQHQYTVLKYAIETYRRNKYKPITGISFLGLVDCWPSITWSVVDYYRNPKKGYYAVKTAYQPILASIVLNRREVVQGAKLFREFWLINDLPEKFYGATVALRLESAEEEAEKAVIKEEFQIDIRPDSAVKIHGESHSESKWNVPSDLKPGRYILKALVFSSQGTVLSTNCEHVEVFPSVARVTPKLE